MWEGSQRTRRAKYFWTKANVIRNSRTVCGKEVKWASRFVVTTTTISGAMRSLRMAHSSGIWVTTGRWLVNISSSSS